jgi:hypothetical protein
MLAAHFRLCSLIFPVLDGARGTVYREIFLFHGGVMLACDNYTGVAND